MTSFPAPTPSLKVTYAKLSAPSTAAPCAIHICASAHATEACSMLTGSPVAAISASRTGTSRHPSCGAYRIVPSASTIPDTATPIPCPSEREKVTAAVTTPSCGSRAPFCAISV